MKFPPQEALPLAVFGTDDPTVVFVQSRDTLPAGGWWCLERVGPGWRCPCPGFERFGRCAHATAARTHTPRLTEVPVHESDDEALWQYAANMYTPGA